MKEKQFQRDVSETLLIPLKARCAESLAPDGLFHDLKSVELVKKLNLRDKVSKMARVGSSIRASYFDKAVKNFVDAHRQPLVVILGCGLDDRQARMSMDQVPFVMVDFEDVIRVRSKFLPTNNPQTKTIACSILEKRWMKQVQRLFPKKEVIFILEGVSMYFTEQEMRQLIEQLTKNFTAFELWLDALSPKIMKYKKMQRAFKKRNIQFHWGIENKKQLNAQLGTGFTIKSYVYLLTLYPKKWGIWYKIAKVVPMMKKSSQLIGLSYQQTMDAHMNK